MPAVYLFVVDVSCAQMSGEVVKSLAGAIQASLDKLQGDDRKRIGFLTFDRFLVLFFFGSLQGCVDRCISTISNLRIL